MLAVAALATLAAAQPKVSRGFMIGKWGALAGKCDKVFHLLRDGRAETPYGKATWTIDRDRLTIHGGPGGAIKYGSTVTALGRNRIKVVTDWGVTDVQRRC